MDLKFLQFPGGYALRTLKVYGETMFAMNKSKSAPIIAASIVSHIAIKNSLRWGNTEGTSNASKTTFRKDGLETSAFWLSRSVGTLISFSYGKQMIFMGRVKKSPC